MLDKWFKSDIDKVLKDKNQIVIVDEKKQCKFLVDTIKNSDIKIYEVENEINDLEVKYDIEKNRKEKKSLIYTIIPLGKLKFIREYCETAGFINIKYLSRYIQDKIHENLGIDRILQPEELIALGKSSIGKENEFWSQIKGKGIDGIFDDTQFFEFFKDPENFYENIDAEQVNVFNEHISKLASINIHGKPPATIAEELVNTIFDNIIFNENNSYLNNLYEKWLDSRKYSNVIHRYASKYPLKDKLGTVSDVWSINSNHPFEDIDLLWIKQIAEQINNEEWIKTKIDFIRDRADEGITEFLKTDFWKYVLELLSYNEKKLLGIKSIDELIEYYTSKFYKLDTAIRNLYKHFLHKKTVIKPFQEYYFSLLDIFLQKWFENFDEYETAQINLLAEIAQDKEETAVIIADGLNYELGQEIKDKIGSSYIRKIRPIKANFPSVTDNNMSKIFGLKKVENIKGKREEYFAKNCSENVTFCELEDISQATQKCNLLVCYTQDIDAISEKTQLKALKHFNQIIESTVEKAKILLRTGFKKVIIISDHGFVLSGILEEADKTEFNHSDIEKMDRYALSNKKISPLPKNIIEIEKEFKGYNYLYFAKSILPFKTKGKYGYSHGGISPQELITPLIELSSRFDEINMLDVKIRNKKDLQEVIVDNVEVKISAEHEETDLLSMERSVVLVFIDQKKVVKESDIIRIKPGEEISREYSFKDFKKLTVILQDADTRKNLDQCDVIKKTTRDLGGL